jgi:pimeloyl-ACP methyl ester carboxylesterase
MTRRWSLAAGAAGVLLAGAAAWETQRRRDARSIRADPRWQELNRPVHGRAVAVRSRDGTMLHAEVHGDERAPAVVLSHGWLESLELWQRQVTALAESHHVVVYDQRGHGRSAVPDDRAAYSADHLADDLQAVLDTCLPGQRRCVVAGHSMGGMAILAWAGRNPDTVPRRLAGAVLVNTATHDVVSRYMFLPPIAGARFNTLFIPPVLRLYRPLTTRLDPVTLRIIRRIVGGRDTSIAEAAYYHRMFLACPAPVRTGFGMMFTSLDLRESIAALTVPSIVIAGHDDRLLPPSHSQDLAAALPDLVEYIEVQRLGHMAPIEAADTVSDSIRQLAAPLHQRGPARRRRRTPSRTAKGRTTSMSTVDDDTHTEEPGTDVDETETRKEKAERAREEQQLDEQDERVAESFPASDPPAY